jgi:hypothetical protein
VPSVEVDRDDVFELLQGLASEIFFRVGDWNPKLFAGSQTVMPIQDDVILVEDNRHKQIALLLD